MGASAARRCARVRNLTLIYSTPCVVPAAPVCPFSFRDFSSGRGFDLRGVLGLAKDPAASMGGYC